jgi:hypothetical protein
VITKRTVCRVDTDPSGAWKENVDPGVKSALGAAPAGIDAKFAQKPAYNSDRQADLAQNGRTKKGRIPTGTRSQFDRLRRQSRLAFLSNLVSNFPVQGVSKIDQRVDGIQLPVQLPDLACVDLLIRADCSERGNDTAFLRRVFEWEMQRVRSQQKMEWVPGPELDFKRNSEFQDFARPR